MKRKDVKNGYIEYRIPDVAELLIFLGEMGIGNEDLAELSGNEDKSLSPKQMIFTGKLLKKIEPFIAKIEICKENGEKLNCMKQLLQNSDYLGDLTEIGMSLMQALGVSEEKKD